MSEPQQNLLRFPSGQEVTQEVTNIPHNKQPLGCLLMSSENIRQSYKCDAGDVQTAFGPLR